MRANAFLLAAIVWMAITSTCQAGKSFLDDFEDGSVTDANPVTWVREPPPFHLGSIEVRDGGLLLTAPSSGPNPIPTVPNYWEMGIASDGQLYHDVDIRTQVRSSLNFTSAVVMGALDTYFTDGQSGTGVYFGFVVDGGAPWALINSEINGIKQELSSVQGLTYSHQTGDLSLRLNIQDLEVRAWAWPTDEAEPAEPLLHATLPASFAEVEGRVELGAGSRTTAVPVWFRYVSVVPNPSGVVGDFNNNGQLEINDLDDLSQQAANGNNDLNYDLNTDSLVDREDRRVWVEDLYRSWFGDADLNGFFDSSDLVKVMVAGAYEVDVDATWSTGDFDGNGRFDSSDLVVALAGGGYEAEPRAARMAVPEPCSAYLLLIGLAALAGRRITGCHK
jgi:hypothetical protein